MDMANYETAAAIFRCLWDGISPDYKSKYRFEIWEQFQHRIQAHAKMTNSLPVLLSRLCLTFGNATLGRDPQQRDWLESVLREPRQHAAILAACREQAPVIVLLIRTLIHDEKEVAA